MALCLGRDGKWRPKSHCEATGRDLDIANTPGDPQSSDYVSVAKDRGRGTPIASSVHRADIRETTVMPTREDILDHRGRASAYIESKCAMKSSGVRATFELEKKLPAALSQGVSRHDNDHADIREISIMPTREEILSHRGEYLPGNEPQEWHLEGMPGRLIAAFERRHSRPTERCRQRIGSNARSAQASSAPAEASRCSDVRVQQPLRQRHISTISPAYVIAYICHQCGPLLLIQFLGHPNSVRGVGVGPMLNS